MDTKEISRLVVNNLNSKGADLGNMATIFVKKTLDNYFKDKTTILKIEAIKFDKLAPGAMFAKSSQLTWEEFRLCGNIKLKEDYLLINEPSPFNVVSFDGRVRTFGGHEDVFTYELINP